MSFAPEYVRYVLNENFEDAKALFVEPLVAIDYAHLVMLHDHDIVSRGDARRIRNALDGVSIDAVRQAQYDGTCEDLFFYVRQLVAGALDEDTAGRLHTARSRNDIDMTMYRMRQREFVLGLFKASLELRTALVGIASAHRYTIFAAHTHTQPAQPTTVAHYLLGMIEQLERDGIRLKAAFLTTNRCPLGACAITGTGFPIDRWMTASLLGFDSPTRNTYGSIATVDYLLENMGATAGFLVGLGRFVQDMLLWCTAEFGYLRLPDGFVQCSSIMPQKRNPVALEHARALCSKAVGQALGIFGAVHNTPFGDIVDTEDDLQPLVFSALKDATRASRLVAAAMAGADFDVEAMARRAGEGWITVTELADTLVRDHHLPFQRAHAIAGRVVQLATANGGRPLSAIVREASTAVIGRPVEYTDDQLREILSPKHFVSIRKTLGGPSPIETELAIEESRARLTDDQTWLDDRLARLKDAENELKERAAGL